MKNIFEKIALAVSKVNQQHIQMVMAILVLSLLVLGAGAPAGGGDTLPGVGH